MATPEKLTLILIVLLVLGTIISCPTFIFNSKKPKSINFRDSTHRGIVNTNEKQLPVSGIRAGNNLVTSSYNTVIGYDVYYSNSSVSSNIALHYPKDTPIVLHNIAFGYPIIDCGIMHNKINISDSFKIKQ